MLTLRPLAARAALASCSLALVAATLAGCSGVSKWRPTVAASYAVAEDYEVEVTDGSDSITGDTDYESIELVVGGTGIAEDGDKISRPEARLGAVEFEDVDALEFAVGGRFYLGGGRVSPYLAVHGVATVFDDVVGIELGTQFGARGGAGIELDITDSLFVDVGVDYTVPLVAAEDELDVVETEVEGLAVRIGAGFRF